MSETRKSEPTMSGPAMGDPPLRKDTAGGASMTGFEQARRSMRAKRVVWSLVVLVGLGLGGVAVYRALRPPEIDLAKYPPVPPPSAPQSAPAQSKEPQPQYPVAQEDSEKPLPALDKSDQAVAQALRGVWSGNTLERLLDFDDFIRRTVATVDNLPAKKLPRRILPVRQAPGRFLTTGKGENLAIGPDNSARYGAYVRMLETVDVQKVGAVYAHFYPLFQKAYQELGYPKGYFNDRLVAAIDSLLATPEVKGPIKVIKPEAFYLFADPELEALSAGQKVMLRMGSDNAARVKHKLREIRDELTRQAAKQ